MLALDFDVVGLEQVRLVVVVLRERVAKNERVPEQGTIAASLPRLFLVVFVWRESGALPFPPLLGTFRTSENHRPQVEKRILRSPMPGEQRGNDEKRWRTTLSMLALDFDVVELEGVVPSSSSSFCERERRRMSARATQPTSKQRTTAASLPRSRPLSLAVFVGAKAGKQTRPPPPAVAGNLPRTSREPSRRILRLPLPNSAPGERREER
jgi:hypothetical protein